LNNLLKEKCNELNIPFINLETDLLNNNAESLYINNHADHDIQNIEGISKINNIITQFITNNNTN
jgi:hypothetical protein